MAAFNQSENEAVIGTGLSNASRGMPADQSLGTLFEGLGDALRNGLNAYDESTKVKIQMAADAAVNGPNGAVAAATPDAEGNLPPGSEEYLGNIASLKNALSQGVIAKNVYDTRMAVEAKRLRASVPPGYGMYVDQALSSASGSSMANQALQTRLATIDQLQRQGNAAVDEVKTWMAKSEVNEVLSVGVVKERFRRRTGGYTIEQMISDPVPEFFDELQLSVADWKKDDAEFKRWEQGKKMGEHQTTESTRLAADKLFQEAFFSNTTGPMLDYVQKLAEIQKDGTIDSKEYEQIAPLWAKVKTDAQARLSQTFMVTRASKEDRAAIQSEMDNIFKVYEDALTHQDYGALNVLTKSMAREQDIAAKKLYGSNAEVRALAALKRNNVPDQVGSSLFIEADGSKIKDAAIAAVTAAAVASGDASAGEVMDSLADTRKNPNGDIRGLMSNLSKILNSPVNTPEGVANVAVNIFSAKNQDMLDRINPENRIAAFEQFLSPVVIQRLQESGNADALEFAQQWGIKQFDAISKYAKDTVMDAQMNRLMVDIKFENNRFVWNPRNPTTGERMTMLSAWEWEKMGAKQAYKAVSDLNRYIAVMEPLWAKDQMDPATALSMMQWEDVNKVGKAPTLMKTLGDAIWNSISNPDGKESKAGAISGTAQASIPKDEKVATNKELTAQVEKPKTSGKSIVAYANQGATRNLKLTNVLESRIDQAVRDVYGEGYTVQVFSGGQPKKGSGGKRTGSIRHDEGKAADIYLIGPDGKRITDTAILDKLVEHWESNGLGSVGRYMRGGGIHLDEWTKDKLLAGMGSSWRY